MKLKAPGPPPLPNVRLEVIEDLSPKGASGFLRLLRRRFRAHYPDGSASEPFEYDEVDRRAIDAAVMLAHYEDARGVPYVYLRSSVRPPVAMRDKARSPLRDEHDHGGLWELPAGLVEPGEQTPEGVVGTAQRELLEELGFEVERSQLLPLGPSVFPVASMCAERQFFFHVAVDPNQRRAPELDGSPLERFGEVIDVPLASALAWCADGSIEDCKTEIGLRRFADIVTRGRPSH
ncbi:MAG TPA: NUDIX domain-containing protein [Polyangiaceae bacterium]|nr:NUDIX domain-containing protein [Polyangiaceae bacterium]